MRMTMFWRGVLLVAAAMLVGMGCSDKNNMTGTDPQAVNLAKNGLNVQDIKYNQTNLVSDISMPGARMDANLVNAWGLAVTPTGRFWISDNGTSLSTIYDSAGVQVIPPVSIPTVGGAMGGKPSGVVFNFTSVFMLPGSAASKFIFAGEDGIISAWGPSAGSNAVIVADQSTQDAVYKGIEIGQSSGKYYLYATNFKQSKIDVFDENFKMVSGFSFNDPNIPSNYGPFNIKNVNGMLFVTYAKHKAPDNEDDQKGPGNGYVDIYTTAGQLIRRFAAQGTLNSPWGIAEDFSENCAGDILIGNFGDGRINVFSRSGEFKGQLLDKMEMPLSIDGLWALFTSNSIAGIQNRIYFTAGPNDENHGLFGYLLPKHNDEHGHGDKDLQAKGKDLH